MAEVVINGKVKTHEEGNHIYVGTYKWTNIWYKYGRYEPQIENLFTKKVSKDFDE